jgi:hypothetical protein
MRKSEFANIFLLQASNYIALFPSLSVGLPVGLSVQGKLIVGDGSVQSNPLH